MHNLKIAIAQFKSGIDPFDNLLRAHDFILEAEAQGADLVCFPENLFYRGPKKIFGPNSELKFFRNDLALERSAEGILKESHDFSKALKEFSMSWTCQVSLGSVLEKSPNPE